MYFVVKFGHYRYCRSHSLKKIKNFLDFLNENGVIKADILTEKARNGERGQGDIRSIFGLGSLPINPGLIQFQE